MDQYYQSQRGGSWLHLPWYARASYRSNYDPSLRYNIAGFRCVKRDTRPLVGLRGGSWYFLRARASFRLNAVPASRGDSVGFRCCVRRERP